MVRRAALSAWKAVQWLHKIFVVRSTLDVLFKRTHLLSRIP
jgi:hypothetical protein